MTAVVEDLSIHVHCACVRQGRCSETWMGGTLNTCEELGALIAQKVHGVRTSGSSGKQGSVVFPFAGSGLG